MCSSALLVPQRKGDQNRHATVIRYPFDSGNPNNCVPYQTELHHLLGTGFNSTTSTYGLLMKYAVCYFHLYCFLKLVLPSVAKQCLVCLNRAPCVSLYADVRCRVQPPFLTAKQPASIWLCNHGDYLTQYVLPLVTNTRFTL